MKKYTCYVETNWCGDENEYKFRAENEDVADSIAYNLALDNFYDKGGLEGIASDLFGDSYSELEDEEQQEVDDLVDDYFSYSIDEFTGTDEEFDKLDKELYFK